MKKTLLIILFLSSFSAFASFNEVECEGSAGVQRIFVEIEQPFPTTSSFRHVQVTVLANNTQENYSNVVNLNRYNGFSIINYQGAGFRLSLDLWPDGQPRWGRIYSASLISSDINGGIASTLYCKFPNAD
jgi:hypothetical protein